MKTKPKPETWIDAKGQIVYIKGSKYNKTLRLTKDVIVEVTDSLSCKSGTVTKPDGKVFYLPFKKVENP